MFITFVPPAAPIQPVIQPVSLDQRSIPFHSNKSASSGSLLVNSVNSVNSAIFRENSVEF
jgi:hypothetical protein